MNAARMSSNFVNKDIIVRRKNNMMTKELPKVNSYCRECRGTTGKVVDGTETHWEIQCDCGQHWMEHKKAFAQKYLGIDGKAPEFNQREPQVQERSWKDEPAGSQIRQMQELLKDFNIKNGKKEQSGTKEFPMATVVNHLGKLKKPSEVEEPKMVSDIKVESVENSKLSEKGEIKVNLEKEFIVSEEKNEKVELPVSEAPNQKETEELVTFEVAGIKVSFREGITVTVHRVDGQVHVVAK